MGRIWIDRNGGSDGRNCFQACFAEHGLRPGVLGATVVSKQIVDSLEAGLSEEKA